MFSVTLKAWGEHKYGKKANVADVNMRVGPTSYWHFHNGAELTQAPNLQLLHICHKLKCYGQTQKDNAALLAKKDSGKLHERSRRVASRVKFVCGTSQLQVG